MNRSRMLTIACLLVPFLGCFGSVLCRDRSFGFRDTANYYYPLFEWECHEWRAGRVPLWSPLDNGGTPVLADTTSSVLYPGKLLFVLPTSFRWRYHLYVTAHVALAAIMAYKLARHWDCSREGATLAAMSYAFGGSVLFQYCNVVFLVGAAWLPCGLLAADRMLRQRSLGWATSFGAVLALMVLGGDPQAAYHTGLLSAVYAGLIRRGVPAGPGDRESWRTSRPVLLATAAMVGVCLSLVQILPAIEWTRQSSRHSYESPRTIYEAARSAAHARSTGDFARSVAAGCLASPEPGSHLRHVYEFSVGPWHLAELLWPNVFGRMFPENLRWSTALPGEGRTWTPSLYLGLLPLVLGLRSWRVRRVDAQLRFLSLTSLLALLGSFGWYGIGWLVHELHAGLTSPASGKLSIGEPVGGLYWMLVTLLPGYVYFRYPAKLLVIATLGLSLLAARGWQPLVVASSRRLADWFAVLAAISLAAAGGFGVAQPAWRDWLAGAAPDMHFGPLDVAGATRCVLASLLHAAILASVFWFLLRSTHARVVKLRGATLLGITAFELALANGWMTQSIPAEILAAPPRVVTIPPVVSGDAPPPRLYRDSSSSLLPVEWSQQSDDERLARIVAWERETLLPKHHLAAGATILGSHTTLTSADWQAVLRRMQEDLQVRAERQSLVWRALSVDAMITRGSRDASALKSPYQPSDMYFREPEGSRYAPHAWIVHQTKVLPPLTDRSAAAIDRRTREVLFAAGQPRDLQQVAVLETERVPPLNSAPSVNLEQPAERESCRISHYSPQRVELEAQLAVPGVLVLNDTQYPGWRAVRITAGEQVALDIYRANRVMRAVMLPAGKHHVIYTYRPQRFFLGALVSVGGWMLLFAYSLRVVRRAGSFARPKDVVGDRRHNVAATRRSSSSDS